MSRSRASFACAFQLALACMLGACGDDAARTLDAAWPEPVCTSCGACETAITVKSARHLVGDLEYPDRPPASGDHNDCWAAYGVHDTPVPDERWVHTLEHGGVGLLYDCPDGCDDDVAALAKLVKSRPWAFMTSYSDMPTRFAVVAWQHRLTSDCLDTAAFASFYDEHADRAPESIPDDPPRGCPP